MTGHVSRVTRRHLVHVDGQLVEHHPEGGEAAVVVPAPVQPVPHLVPDEPQPDAEVRDHADRVEHHRQPGQSPVTMGGHSEVIILTFVTRSACSESSWS